MGDANEILESLLIRVESEGYSVVRPVKVFDAKDFGVPQTRRRVFVLGYKKGLPAPEYPVTNSLARSDFNSVLPTVWDAIGDLPNLEYIEELLHTDIYYGELGTPSHYASVLRGEKNDVEDLSRRRPEREGLTGLGRTIHTDKTRRRFAATAQGTRESVSRYYRLTKGGISTTLRAGTDRTGGSHTAPRPIHPVYPRCITVREAARLHSLPDWFRLHPTKWHGFRQIGNSVPPLLAREIARGVGDAILKEPRMAVSG